MRAVISLLFGLFSSIARGQTGSLEITVRGLRSGSGFIAASLFSESGRSGFPGRPELAQATHQGPADGQGRVQFTIKDVPFGVYALAVIHDEDGDGKVRMVLGVPREGFGFSRNPAIYFGPPSFDRASFEVGAKVVRIDVTMKYIL